MLSLGPATRAAQGGGQPSSLQRGHPRAPLGDKLSLAQFISLLARLALVT